MKVNNLKSYSNDNCSIGNQNDSNASGFTCGFDPDTLASGDKLEFGVTVGNQYGTSQLSPTYTYTIPGTLPSPPTNIKLDFKNS